MRPSRNWPRRCLRADYPAARTRRPAPHSHPASAGSTSARWGLGRRHLRRLCAPWTARTSPFRGRRRAGKGPTSGSHVVARLVREHGWKVGVVAQGHAVVEAHARRDRAGRAARFGGRQKGWRRRRVPRLDRDQGQWLREVPRGEQHRPAWSAAPRGTSSTPSGSTGTRWTSWSLTRPVSSRSRTRSQSRWQRRGCSARGPPTVAAGQPGHPPRARQ